MAETAKWYVIHTYSGYENKVKTNIEKTVENRGIQDMIQEIRIPMEEVVEVKEKGRRHAGAQSGIAQGASGLCDREDDNERCKLVCGAQYARRDELCRAGVEACSADGRRGL